MSFKIVTLGEVCSIKKGSTGIQKAIPGEYPLVVTAKERKTHNEFQFDDNAVVVPIVSGTGHGHASIKRIHYQEGKFALGSILCAIIPKDKEQLNAKFLYHFLFINKEKELVSRMRGMANVTLPLKEIVKIEFPLPPLEVQLELVEKFEVLEKKSLLLQLELENQLVLIKKLKEQLFEDALHGKISIQDSNDESGSDLLKRIMIEKERMVSEKILKKGKDIPPVDCDNVPFEIPENWAWCRLGDISVIKGGKRVSRGYKLLKKKTPYIYIRVSDMKNGTIDDSKLHYIDKEMYEKIKRYTISKDDIYMTIVGGTIGKCGLVPDKFHNMNLTENAAKVSPIFVDKIFLWKCLKSPFCQKQFIEKTKQVGVQKMAMNRFSSTFIPLPPLEEQRQIVKRLESYFEICSKMEMNIKKNIEDNKNLIAQKLRESLQS